jgi:hypothetical protein
MSYLYLQKTGGSQWINISAVPQLWHTRTTAKVASLPLGPESWPGMLRNWWPARTGIRILGSSAWGDCACLRCVVCHVVVGNRAVARGNR